MDIINQDILNLADMVINAIAPKQENNYFNKALGLIRDNTELSNNFYVVEIFGNSLMKFGSYSFDNLPLICVAAELPGKTLATVSQKTYGPLQKFPVMTEFGDLTLTFVCIGENMYPRNIFEDWIGLINPKNNYNFLYKSSYMSSIMIRQFDRAGNVAYGVNLLEAFPISIYSQKLSFYGAELQTLSVTFTYTDFDYNLTRNYTAEITDLTLSKFNTEFFTDKKSFTQDYTSVMNDGFKVPQLNDNNVIYNAETGITEKVANSLNIDSPSFNFTGYKTPVK